MKLKAANALNILLLLGLAVLVWFYVQQQIIDTADVEFRLDLRVPSEDKFVVISYSVGDMHNSKRITVKLKGSKSQLAEIRGSEFRTVHLPVDVDEAAFADSLTPVRTTIKITDENLNLPANVTLVEAVSVDVWVDVLETKRCPVTLNVRTALGPDGESKWQVKLSPQNVKVTGPRSILSKKEELNIKTEPLDVQSLPIGEPKDLALIDTAKEYESAGAKPGLRPNLKLKLSRPAVEATRILKEEFVKVERVVDITFIGLPDFFEKWKVEISPPNKRKLILEVPESRREAAEQIKLELVLDMRQITAPPEIPAGPLDLRLMNKPEWIRKWNFGDGEDSKVTITGIKQIELGP